MPASPRKHARALDWTSRRVLLIAAGVLALAFVIAWLTPAEDDPTPSTWNAGPGGAKAALLLLDRLGYHAIAYEQPLDRLPLGSAKHTTLILAAPSIPYARLASDQAALDAFLRSGGSVLATGFGGALLLRQTGVGASRSFGRSLCLTQPEGFSRLARAGSLRMPTPLAWYAAPSTDVEVAQRCGTDPVVVRWHPEGGTAIWWSSSEPLSNAGLRSEGDLKLLLASLGPARPLVLFDDFFHGAAAEEPGPLSGLPLPLLAAQAGFVLLLAIFSFSRRHGPVRPLAAAPRTSPVEFAASVGALYERAGAYSAAVEAAKRRTLRALTRYGATPSMRTAVNEALAQADAFDAEGRRAGREALVLVRALDMNTEDMSPTRSNQENP